MRGIKAILLLAGILTALRLAFERLFKLCMYRGFKLKPSLAGLVNLDKEQREMTEALKKEMPNIDSWRRSVKSENWHIRRRSGDTLYAHCFINPRSPKWAVVVHGYGEEGGLMLYAAKRFHQKGYSVLVPDLRAHGKSSGKYVGWGWKDRGDIIDWCGCIKNRCPKAEIVLYGVSMGGAAVLMATGESRLKGVKCVVSDCAYTCLRDIFYYRIRRMLHLPPALVMWWLKPMCKKRMSLSVEDASVLKQVKRAKVPLMFCHGDRDRFVPTDNALELYAAAHSPKRLMLIHGAGHGVSAFTAGEKYWDRVFDFTERFVK